MKVWNQFDENLILLSVSYHFIIGGEDMIRFLVEQANTCQRTSHQGGETNNPGEHDLE